jgi:hypothetical protein
VPGYIFASDEARGRYPDLGGWVDATYLALLGRAPDTSGRAYWVGVAARDPYLVTLGILRSTEGRAARLDRVYRHVLHRAVDPGAISYWGPAADRAEMDWILALASSAEFFARSQTAS